MARKWPENFVTHNVNNFSFNFVKLQIRGTVKRNRRTSTRPVQNNVGIKFDGDCNKKKERTVQYPVDEKRQDPAT